MNSRKKKWGQGEKCSRMQKEKIFIKGVEDLVDYLGPRHITTVYCC